MRFLATADLHLNNYSTFSTIDKSGLNTRLLDGLSVLDEIRRYAIKHKITDFLFLGDLLHQRTKLSIDVAFAAYERLKQFKAHNIRLYLLVGNHDLFLRSNKIFSPKLFDEIALVVDQPRAIDLDGQRLCFIPFIESTKRRKKEIEKLARKDSILLAHTPVIGAKADNEFMLRKGLEFKDLHPGLFKLILLGDFHKHQWLADNVMYLGSPLQLNMGERSEQKGFWDIEVNDKFKATFVPTQAPKFILLDYEEEGEVEVEGNYVKVILPANVDSLDTLAIRHELEMAGAKAVSIEQRAKLEQAEARINLKLGMTFREMVGKYTEGSSTELDKKRLVKVGTELMEGENGY